MVIHNIVDVSPLYFKYAYVIRDKEWIENHEEGDIPNDKVPIMYLVLDEIEKMRDTLEKMGHQVITSACFDSAENLRKKFVKTEEATEYKSGRKKILCDFDFQQLEKMRQIMQEVGINPFYLNGCEADDIIAYLANKSEGYDFTVVYSTDKDMIANVREKVGMRKKTGKEWISIDCSNYEREVQGIFDTEIPFNAIGLYLCTVGDSADKIKGIKGFGKRAFEKLVKDIEQTMKVNWMDMYSYDKVRELLIECKGRLISDTQFEQAVRAFNMVRPIELVNNKEYELGTAEQDEYGFIKIKMYIKDRAVMKAETEQSRKEVYTRHGMLSLAK